MQFKNSKKAFTLIELLIVIAIIGILFVVLVSKVDFATDKAKASGVQTDFRSFQVAFETVAKEHSGFNTFGWNVGDLNADKVRNSFDEGDIGQGGEGTPGYQDGIVNYNETWTGHKVYSETWTDANGNDLPYTLVKPNSATGKFDKDAIFALESAINANLDPKLHITINTDGKITMANGAQDPWKSEYYGVLMTNAEDKGSAVSNTEHGTLTSDALDRGAIIMYSKGANLKDGVTTKVQGGIVTTIVSSNATGVVDNNVNGKDDYSLAVIYTYVNGYGEVKTSTTGFSNNQVDNSVPSNNVASLSHSMTIAPTTISPLADALFVSNANADDFECVKIDGTVIDESNYTVASGSTKVTLKTNYIKTLSDGKHTIAIVSSTGTASCEFSVMNEVKFIINGTEYYAHANMTWSDWILAFNVSAGDNGIVWVGIQDWNGMTHGVMYYLVPGNNLGDNALQYNGEYVMYDDIILPITYELDGPT